jgi:hypothetical protein
LFSFEMTVSNTARSLIDWLRANFGGTEKLTGKSVRQGCPDQWAWVVRGEKARPHLLGIRPYLVIKQRQADLAIKFLDLVASEPDAEKRVEPAERIKAEISALNSLKGKPR